MYKLYRKQKHEYIWLMRLHQGYFILSFTCKDLAKTWSMYFQRVIAACCSINEHMRLFVEHFEKGCSGADQDIPVLSGPLGHGWRPSASGRRRNRLRRRFQTRCRQAGPMFSLLGEVAGRCGGARQELEAQLPGLARGQASSEEKPSAKEGGYRCLGASPDAMRRMEKPHAEGIPPAGNPSRQAKRRTGTRSGACPDQRASRSRRRPERLLFVRARAPRSR